MRALSAAWIAEVTGGELRADPDVAVTDVQRDSRECGPGSLYVAFRGERADGHDFAKAALDAGAVLCLTDKPSAGPHVVVADTVAALGDIARAYLATLREAGSICVIGITGSVGKTTTKDLLAQMLPDAVAAAGSFNNEIGLPLTVLRADEATRYLVLEMGASGQGHIAYLTGIAPPDVAAVLMVGTAHLGEYDSIDAVAEAKAEIIAGRAPGATVVLNADDPRVAAMAELAPGAVTFGVHGGDVRAEGIEIVRGRPQFRLSAGEASADVTLGLVGGHHVTNALAAAAIALASGLSLDETAVRLSAATARSPHRMAVTERSDGVTIIDDSYNASPEAMRAAIQALREVAGSGRTLAVVGEMLEMGEASIAAHDEVGEIAVRLGVDHLVVVGAGAKPTYDAAVREGSFGDEAAFVATIEEARAHVEARLARGDTVLIKGSHGSGLWRLADQLTGGSA